MRNSLLFSADSSEYTVRVMTPADLEAVRYIDRDAFETYRRQQHQMARPLQLRTVENMRTAIQRPHPGVVLEWPRGRVVGYCFTHVWGTLGWLGTLGVAPQNQNFGLGRAVIAAGLRALREAGCQVLALETMPESGKNLALYTREGLEPREMTLLCQGTVAPAVPVQFDVWRAGDALREIAGRLVPGLDPTPAARWLIEEEAGETLVWHEDGRPAAFAVLRAAPRRLEGLQIHLTIEAAACTPEAAAHWPRYLAEMQSYARSRGKTGLILPVSARQIGLLRDLLDQGMQVAYTRVRMVQGAPLGDPDARLLLTLAM